VTAASILLFVQSGLVLLATFYAGIIGTVVTALDGTGRSGSVTAVTLLQLVCVGLLIAAGVLELSGRPQLLWAAVATQLALALYWVFRIDDLTGPRNELDGFGVVPLFFVLAPLVALGLSFAPGARQWGELERQRRAGQASLQT